jgi:hypothetical protein
MPRKIFSTCMPTRPADFLEANEPRGKVMSKSPGCAGVMPASLAALAIAA